MLSSALGYLIPYVNDLVKDFKAVFKPPYHPNSRLGSSPKD